MHLMVFSSSDFIVSNNGVIIAHQYVDRSHHGSSFEYLRMTTKLSMTASI
jgi:hypothetical protein